MRDSSANPRLPSYVILYYLGLRLFLSSSFNPKCLTQGSSSFSSQTIIRTATSLVWWISRSTWRSNSSGRTLEWLSSLATRISSLQFVPASQHTTTTTYVHQSLSNCLHFLSRRYCTSISSAISYWAVSCRSTWCKNDHHSTKWCWCSC